jgi:hypothetical protein
LLGDARTGDCYKFWHHKYRLCRKSEFHVSCFCEQRAHPEYEVLFSEPAGAVVKISLPNLFFRLKRILRCTNCGLAALSRLAELTVTLPNMLLLGSVMTGAEHAIPGALPPALCNVL